MIDRIQEQLESIYGLRCEFRAVDFLVDDASAKALGGTSLTREELLVSESDESLEVALYVEPALVRRFETCQPIDAVSSDLNDFCVMTEGVSHFVYLSHTASIDRHLSLLELEAQAEVDKFAVCTLLKWGSSVAQWSNVLLGRLFDRVSYLEHQVAPERWRYVEANRLAKNYCRRLMPWVKARNLDGLLSELRHAYRLGAEAKLTYFGRDR